MRRKSTLVWGGLALVVIALIAINVALREDPEPEFTPMPESRAPMVEVRLEETDAGQAPAAVAHFIEPVANEEPAAGGEGEAETETAEATEAPETAGCDNPFVPSAPGEWRRYTWQQSGLDQVAELRVEAVAARELPTGQREIAWSVEITSAEDGSPLAREQITTRCTFGRGAEEPWFGILERSRGLTPIDSPERWRWPSHLSAHQTFEGTAQFDPTGADMRIPTGVRGPQILRVTRRHTVEEREAVGVPAGRYRAWRVGYEEQHAFGPRGEQGSGTVWVAPGVGMVKSRSENQAGVVQTIELAALGRRRTP